MVQQQVSEHANQGPQTSKTKMGPTWLPDAAGILWVMAAGISGSYTCTIAMARI